MRRRLLVLLAASLLAPVLPSASAATTVVVPSVTEEVLALGTVTVALHRERAVGVTWRAGNATVSARWRTAAGWSAWEVAEENSDAPEPAERARAVRGTEPLWPPRGASALQLRVDGDAAGRRLVRVTDGTARTVTGPARAEAATRVPLLGVVRSRADWGADESVRRGSAGAARTVRAVVVHHTANRNDYGADDVPAILRADYAYHVHARGWGDLGYNLVVDRFGRVWEGRAGGLRRATVGAHAQGFNTGTLGVGVLGDYTRTTPTRDVTRALSRVVAHAAATWRMDPTGRVALTSGGSPRYPRGRVARLSTVFGHGETGQTACPGSLQDRLGQVRAGARALLGPAPRVLEVAVSGAPVRAPQPVRLTARLSRTTPWRVALRDPSGRVVVHTEGTGARASLLWNGLVPPVDGGPALLPALPGRYTWVVVTDNGFHPEHRRRGAVQVGLPVVGA